MRSSRRTVGRSDSASGGRRRRPRHRGRPVGDGGAAAKVRNTSTSASPKAPASPLRHRCPPIPSGARLLRPAHPADRRHPRHAGGHRTRSSVRWSTLLRFTDEDEAVRIANGTQFGLVAGVFSQDSDRVVRVSRRIRAGTVFVNNYVRVAVGSGFGGVGHSGFGREHAQETLAEYGYHKTIRLAAQARGAAALGRSHQSAEGLGNTCGLSRSKSITRQQDSWPDRALAQVASGHCRTDLRPG